MAVAGQLLSNVVGQVPWEGPIASATMVLGGVRKQVEGQGWAGVGVHCTKAEPGGGCSKEQWRDARLCVHQVKHVDRGHVSASYRH